jgi:hypothetical protein
MSPRLTLLTVLLGLGMAPALAGNATAESIWDRQSARQQALQQVPTGAVVSRTSCEEFSVGRGDNSRYRCTVWWNDPAKP